MIRFVSIVMAVVAPLAGCASSSADVNDPPQPARARAALATLAVDNRSVENLSIYYRMTAPPATEVRVGQVAATSIAEMAPVPAGEALILIARTQTGAELVMPPRTFGLDGNWVWRIAAGTRFVRPPDSHTP